MTCVTKLMGLLTFEDDFVGSIEVGKIYTVKKSGYRIVPFQVPMELADANFKYLGKAKVIKVVVESDFTIITFEVLKVFTEEESRVYSANFI